MKKYSAISVILIMLLLLSVCMFAVSCGSNQDPDPSVIGSGSQEETVPGSGESQTSGEMGTEDENDHPDSPVNAANDDIAEDDFS